MLERLDSEMDNQPLAEVEVDPEDSEADTSKGIGIGTGLLGSSGFVGPLGTPLLASHVLKKKCREVFGLDFEAKLECIRSGTLPSKVQLFY